MASGDGWPLIQPPQATRSTMRHVVHAMKRRIRRRPRLRAIDWVRVAGNYSTTKRVCYLSGACVDGGWDQPHAFVRRGTVAGSTAG